MEARRAKPPAAPGERRNGRGGVPENVRAFGTALSITIAAPHFCAEEFVPEELDALGNPQTAIPATACMALAKPAAHCGSPGAVS
jgi:hypothetical protein